MIKVVRSVHPRMGKGLEAMQHAKALTDYANRKFPAMHWEVFMAESGKIGTIYWLGESESLATLEQEDAAFGADPGWMALLQQGDSLWVDGSFRNRTLRSL